MHPAYISLEWRYMHPAYISLANATWGTWRCLAPRAVSRRRSLRVGPACSRTERTKAWGCAAAPSKEAIDTVLRSRGTRGGAVARTQSATGIDSCRRGTTKEHPPPLCDADSPEFPRVEQYPSNACCRARSASRHKLPASLPLPAVHQSIRRHGIEHWRHRGARPKDMHGG